MPSQSKQKAVQRTSKKSGRKLRLLPVFLLCFLGWALVTLWDQQSMLKDKQSQLQDLSKELAQVQQTTEAAKKEIARLNDKEYIEQKIRKELNYTKDGETLFTTPSP
ncbi:septum formation initiator family protein [Paenibacillus sp. N1-5-1-14]|uniref:FtsB family cell division protein n=1 Tax=Paenibacillus radicibacter TaxID=2972488 RepID=UPI0021596EE9|nr:septum formation initiator family protein [Paenibacillus radicibacter]MCR8645856.1 septum formation initiator family protein [Paenibacillus radicibacter]